MAGFAEYDSYDALGLAELVRTGQVSSAELVAECISRIERVNPQINSVVFELFDAARARSSGDLGDGPFAGVPFLVKDLIQRIPGVPTQEGSRFFEGWTPTRATTLYRRWLDAGVVPVAKTATHGPDETTPYFAAPIDGTFLGATESDPRPLRIAFHSEPPLPATVHPDCRAAVEDAAQLCAELGHHVEEVAPGHDALTLGRAFLLVVATNIATEIREGEQLRRRRATSKDFQLTTWTARMLGEAVSAQDFLVSLRALQTEARRLVDVYRGYDLVLTPTLGTPPARIGELQPRGADRLAQKVIAALNWKAPLSSTKLIDQAAQSTYSFIPFSPVANFTGQPSMSVPLYWSAEGLPIGVMFTGHPAEETRMFALAAQLERARPWRDRRPPVHAGNKN